MMFFLRLIKRVLHTRFTEADLLGASGNMISQTPFPTELRESFASITDRDGRSLLDVWRTLFQKEIHSIAEKPTWDLQKAAMLDTTLSWKSWEAIYRVSEKAKHLESWGFVVRDNPAFKAVEPEGWSRRILEMFWIGLASSSCLEALGFNLFGFKTTKSTEIQLYMEYEKEIRTLDVSWQDLIHDWSHRASATVEDTATVEDLKNIKDNEVNPIIAAQFRLLSTMRDEIVYGTLNVKGFEQKFRELQAKLDAMKARLGKKSAVRDWFV
jgi:hypothetical protein